MSLYNSGGKTAATKTALSDLRAIQCYLYNSANFLFILAFTSEIDITNQSKDFYFTCLKKLRYKSK